MIILDRYYTPFGVWGDLQVEDFTCSTLENPWLGNETHVSCIPEGTYSMALRFSNVVKRVTDGRYEEGWEIQGVDGRTYIMFHPGNIIKHTDGCVLVGDEKIIYKDELFITDSQDTFDELMEVLDSRLYWDIQIRGWMPEYP